MSIIKTAFDRGMTKLDEEHEVAEQAKLGNLRGGSGGLYQGGKLYGNCARLARLRMEGVSVEELGYERKLMFQAGFSNEDDWVKTLAAGLPEGWHMKCEEEIPVHWQTSRGTNVTGRPDVVLFEGDEARVGIELKLVCSLWTARDVGFNLKPKLDHCIQAAHYSWKLGDVPFELWYTSRSDFAVGGGWEQKTFPKVASMPDWMRRRIDVSNMKDRSGKKYEGVKKIFPFMQGYELKWMNRGQLAWRPIMEDGSQDQWQMSPVTKTGIEAYYEFVDAGDNIGPLPTNADVNGEAMSWKKCSYCPLAETCKGFTPSTKFDEWRSAVLNKLATKE